MPAAAWPPRKLPPRQPSLPEPPRPSCPVSAHEVTGPGPRPEPERSQEEAQQGTEEGGVTFLEKWGTIERRICIEKNYWTFKNLTLRINIGRIVRCN